MSTRTYVVTALERGGSTGKPVETPPGGLPRLLVEVGDGDRPFVGLSHVQLDWTNLPQPSATRKGVRAGSRAGPKPLTVHLSACCGLGVECGWST